ncbi:hypothetical protein [Microvirga massiliensis]|uniref:hypothetical protein n=1 Tax=Microvirga massiliensis TaxID=1033741 RepID=UPI00062BBC8E|nr:hypothetical protein [Microvirga massiliensis]
MNAATAGAQVRPSEDDFEPSATYPGELKPLLQSLLATLADIDFAFERDLEAARASSMEEVLKQRAIERLMAHHRERREPYVRQLTALHSRILSLVA